MLTSLLSVVTMPTGADTAYSAGHFIGFVATLICIGLVALPTTSALEQWRA